MLLNRQIGRRRFLALTAGAAALIGLGSSACVNAATLALRNARLFSGTGLPPKSDMTVAMLGPTIIAVGRDAEMDLSRDTKVIDCRGAFVMPGIIDTHVHVTEPLLRREMILPGWLRAGVTTIRDTGTIFQGPALLRDLVSQLGPAPRVIATGGILTVTDGYPATRGGVGVAAALQVAGVQGAIDGVNMTLDAGGEFIKIAVETGIPGGRLLEDAGSPTLSLEQVKAIVETAHGRGVIVIAHVTNEWELRRAVEGGVDSLAHTPLDDIPSDLLRTLVDRKIPMTGTLNIWGTPTNTVTANAQRNVAKLVKAGGIVAMGTDYPFQVHSGVPIEELKLMRGAGLTNEQVLLSCTRDAAIACARPDLGTIEPGKVADVIVVDGDPLINIAALERVTSVIHDGVVVR